jgi:hypothetical protein
MWQYLMFLIDQIHVSNYFAQILAEKDSQLADLHAEKKYAVFTSYDFSRWQHNF